MGEGIDNANSDVPSKPPPTGPFPENGEGTAGIEAGGNEGAHRMLNRSHGCPRHDQSDCMTGVTAEHDIISRGTRQTYAHVASDPAIQPPLQSPRSESRQVEQLRLELLESQETGIALLEREMDNLGWEARALEDQRRHKHNTKIQLANLERERQRLLDDAKVLTRELQETKAKLDATRSHILSIQPYVKDVTPEEVGRDFDDLYASVCNWVETWMTPIFDDQSGCREVLERARRDGTRFAGLRSIMKSHPDLLKMTEFPDTNQDATVAIIMRYLNSEIFQEVLSGISPGEMGFLQEIEHSMSQSVQPKRDALAVRSWRAETFTSLINHRSFGQMRQQRSHSLTLELGKLFLYLLPHPSGPNEFYLTLESKIVGPAMRLNEKIQTSIHQYWFELTEFRGLSGGGNDNARASELLDDFDKDKVECEDVLRNRKRLELDSSLYSRTDIIHVLYPICSLTPRLMMRQVGRGEIIKGPTVVRKQKTLIAGGTPYLEGNILKLTEQTLMNLLYYTRANRASYFQRFLAKQIAPHMPE